MADFRSLLESLAQVHDREVSALQAEIDQRRNGYTTETFVTASSASPPSPHKQGSTVSLNVNPSMNAMPSVWESSPSPLQQEEFETEATNPDDEDDVRERELKDWLGSSDAVADSHHGLHGDISGTLADLVENVVEREHPSHWRVHMAHTQRVLDAKCSWIKGIVEAEWFDTWCACMIISNAIILGVVIDMSARDRHLSSTLVVTMNLFTSAWFLIELILRFLADGFTGFFYASPYACWNVFDLAVVSIDAVEMVVAILDGNLDQRKGDYTAMRLLRVLRIARALRVLRLASFFKELRLMILSILKSGITLLWSIFLLAIILYLFSIYFLSVTVSYRDEHDDEKSVYFADRFMNMGWTCYTLFKAVSGGLDWGELGDRLWEVHWTNGCAMVFFVFFTVNVMLNIITGIFVETALNSAHQDREEMIEEEQHEEKLIVMELKGIFDSAGVGNGGEIDYDEFSSLVADARARALLTALGLEFFDKRRIFQMIDVNHSGTIKVDQFLFACMRLRGVAKSLDIAMAMYESRKMMVSMLDLNALLKRQFHKIAQRDLILFTSIQKLAAMQQALHTATASAGDHNGLNVPSVGTMVDQRMNLQVSL